MNVTIEDLPNYVHQLRGAVSMLPSVLCMYVNLVMLSAICRKPAMRGSSRYILFAHLLVSDVLQLVLSMVVHMFTLLRANIYSFTCLGVIMLTTLVTSLSPLNLGMMSLERYISICFPLRHVEIATSGRTLKVIVVIWMAASLRPLTQMIFYVTREKSKLALCDRDILFKVNIYYTIGMSFTITSFLGVAVIVVYTYFAIIYAVRSTTSASVKATKAQWTVLLHMFQLFLCLGSTFFQTITAAWSSDKTPLRETIKYGLYLTLVIFPRCLSPLVYGLRDKQVREVFVDVFTCGLRGRIKISVRRKTEKHNV